MTSYALLLHLILNMTNENNKPIKTDMHDRLSLSEDNPLSKLAAIRLMTFNMMVNILSISEHYHCKAAVAPVC